MPSSHGCGSGGGCQSQCLRQQEEDDAAATPSEVAEVDAEHGTRRALMGLSISEGAGGAGPVRLCSKCGEAPEVHNRHCLGCFRSSLFGKFKLAVTSNAMVSPVDRVLVAFSGGPASRIALQFIHEMQLKSQKSWDASKDQSLPVFGVGVAFIDESSVSLFTSDEVNRAIERTRLLVSSLGHPVKELHIAKIEGICSMDSLDGRTRLNKLLDTISDSTGKEDFLQFIRMLSLQKIALENGYNKLMLGSCTSGIACHILSATVKGQGYSLPADVQYIDARWDVPVVLPLRDCLSQELNLLCQLDGLETQPTLDRPHFGINGLISSFLSRLQEENPSRPRTIVRTAEKLSPFSFNKLDNICDDLLPSRVRCKFQDVRARKPSSLEALCPICGSPIDDLHLQTQKSILVEAQAEQDIFAAHCCESCRYQILPKDASSLADFYSLLPQPIARRVKAGSTSRHSWLREQVKDFILSEDDGDESFTG